MLNATIASISTFIICIAYFLTKNKSVDNLSLYALIDILSSFFLQAFGFVIFGTESRYIDTISVDSVKDYFTLGACILFLYSVLIFITTVIFSSKEKHRDLVLERINYKRLNYILLSCIGMTILGLVLFASSIGESVLSLAESSSKRIVISEEGNVEFTSNGYARFLTTIGSPALLFYTAYLIHYKRKFTQKEILLLLLLIGAAIVPPSLLSARGAALYVFISVFIMLLIKKMLNFRLLFFGSILVISLFSMLTAARFATQDESQDNSGLVYAIESKVFYGGGMSLFNTAIISQEFSNLAHPIMLGDSYLGLLTAPIPRSIWINKPVFAYDQQIARNIYHINGAGAQAIPAGIIGESIINFGILGAWIFIPIILIIGIRLHNYFLSIKRSFLAFIIRTIIFPKFMVKLIASGVGFAVMDSALLGFVVFLLYFGVASTKKISHE